MYSNSSIIVEGTVENIENIDDNNQKCPISKIQFSVNDYYKNSINDNSNIITIYQDGNSKTEFEGNPLMKRGQKYILFLTNTSDGGYIQIGGPQGIFDVLKVNSESVVINHTQEYIKNYLDKIGVHSSQIKYKSLSEFRNSIRNTLVSIE